MNKYLPKDLELIERILQKLPSNIFFKDKEGKYVFATHYWQHLKQEGEDGWTIKGKTDSEIRKDLANARLSEESDRKIIESGIGCSYVTEYNLDGIEQYLEVIKEPVENEAGEVIGIVGLINDVTDRIMLEKKLQKLAQTDTLTGLYNRSYLNSWILHETTPDMYPMCIISADCNELKRINDSYGHIIGDEYLRLSATLFRLCAPQNAKMFRIGGDEFIIALPNSSAYEGGQLIKKIKESSSLLTIKGEQLSVALGLSMYEKAEDSFLAVLEEADQEMYKDKKLHRNK